MTHGPKGPWQEAIAAARTVEELPKREMYATESELMKNFVPLEWRDYCAHVLIPLNRCRRDNLYMNWKCMNQKHAYEKCQYEDFMWRQKKLELEKQAGVPNPGILKVAASAAAAASSQ